VTDIHSLYIFNFVSLHFFISTILVLRGALNQLVRARLYCNYQIPVFFNPFGYHVQLSYSIRLQVFFFVIVAFSLAVSVIINIWTLSYCAERQLSCLFFFSVCARAWNNSKTRRILMKFRAQKFFFADFR
jgi:hypothetical protein